MASEKRREDRIESKIGNNVDENDLDKNKKIANTIW